MFWMEVSVKARFPDPEGDRLEKDIGGIGITTVKEARVSDIYFLEGTLDEAEVIRIGRELLADPVVEDFSWGESLLSRSEAGDTHVIEVAYNMAHGEGKVVAKPGAIEEPDVALHYAGETGDMRAGYPHKPNGSVNNIAGICDATGHIFALRCHTQSDSCAGHNIQNGPGSPAGIMGMASAFF